MKQKQFLGDDREINLETVNQEFIEWKWILPEKLPDVFPDQQFSQIITSSGANASISIANTTIEVISANTKAVFLY